MRGAIIINDDRARFGDSTCRPCNAELVIVIAGAVILGFYDKPSGGEVAADGIVEGRITIAVALVVSVQEIDQFFQGVHRAAIHGFEISRKDFPKVSSNQLGGGEDDVRIILGVGRLLLESGGGGFDLGEDGGTGVHGDLKIGRHIGLTGVGKLQPKSLFASIHHHEEETTCLRLWLRKPRTFYDCKNPPMLRVSASSYGLPFMTFLPFLAEAATVANPADLRIWAYVGFIGLIMLFLALDLGVFHREAHEVSMKESLVWSAIWLSCGISFTAFVYLAYEHHWLGLGLQTAKYVGGAIVLGEVTGGTAAIQYLTGYVVEKSLAMDNIFVIAMVFGYFAIPRKYQHRVLFWGIIGALIMRGGMIYLGAELIMRYTWILIFFGFFLILTALKMALIESNDDPGTNPVVKIAKKVFRTVDFFDGQKFFTRRTIAPHYITDLKSGKVVYAPAELGTLSAKLAVTPLFLALIMVEITDLVFAVDSIPAVFAITPDPFIVFTSNIFAILGLRALYFCLAALIAKFRFLKPALILILAYVGVKLLLLALPPYLNDWGLSAAEVESIKIDPILSLVIVLGTLTVASVMSVLLPAKDQEAVK